MFMIDFAPAFNLNVKGVTVQLFFSSFVRGIKCSIRLEKPNPRTSQLIRDERVVH